VSDLEIRPSTDDDLDAFLDVAQRAFSHATGRQAHWTVDGMRRMRAVHAVEAQDPGVRFPVVTRGEQVVAWAGVFANSPYTEIFTDLHVDPELGDDEATAATALLVDYADGQGRGAAGGSAPHPGRTLALEAVDSAVRLIRDLEALGFARDRFEYEMAIELDDVVPEPAWPDGVLVAAMRGPEDTEVVTALLAETFADHPGDVPFSARVLGQVLGGPDFDAAASAIVHDDEGPVGLVLSRGRPESGYVWVLGVAVRARRRGLGARLLQHAFHAFAAAGTSLVLLDVDGSNDSGALEVYANAGMTARTTKVVLTRPLPG
jgi:ribosomal protein S18 acetylase RimI-like enzyme